MPPGPGNEPAETRSAAGVGVANRRRVSVWRPADVAPRPDRLDPRAPPTRRRPRGPDHAPRYEHVGFGDQFEPEPLLPRALEEFHMPRRKTQRN